MPLWKQALLRRYSEPASGETGSNTGGTSTGAAGASGDTPPTDEGKPDDNKTPANEGARKPTDEEARLLKEVMQKKDALKKTADDLAAANNRLKEFDGIDPAAVRTLLSERKTAEEAALEAKGEWTRLKERMAADHEASTKQLKDQVEALTNQLNGSTKVINELTVGTSFGQSQFIAENMVLTPAKARVVYGTHFDLVDGKVVGYDKPRGESNRTALVDQYGNNVPFDEALRKIVEADPEKDHMLKSKVKPGANSSSKSDVSQQQRQSKPAPGADSLSKIGAGLASLNINLNK